MEGRSCPGLQRRALLIVPTSPDAGLASGDAGGRGAHRPDPPARVASSASLFFSGLPAPGTGPGGCPGGGRHEHQHIGDEPVPWLAALAVGAGVTAFAQVGERPSDREVKQIIEEIDRARDRFEDQLDPKVKASIIRNERGELNVERYLDDLQDNLKNLKDRFDSEYAASKEADDRPPPEQRYPREQSSRSRRR